MFRVLTFSLSLFFFSKSLVAQVERIEPMNWWVGMKHPGLQLLVHGKDIGNATPVISYPGVTIQKVHRADSRNYLFIDLLVSKTAKPGTFSIVFKNGAAVVATSPYTLLPRRAEAGQLKGFSSSDVIYLVTPDRFANGDPSNDVVSSMREKKADRKDDYGRHGGDIRGIIDHLDYIAGMGFTALWPTPLLENDMPAASYHGYAITDHYKVDPRFGKLEDYKELAAKCREKGLKLIFDGVVNHIGSHYWWMEDLPFRNWINYPDSMKVTNHRRTVHEDPYASAADKELMVKGWFVPSMPDLNQENPFLAEYLVQNSIWWVETLSLGGIRQDTYPYSPKKFLGQWTCRILQEYPQFSIVGEEWSTNPLVASYWQQGKSNNSGYNGCLKSTMDFPLQTMLVQALSDPETWDKGLPKLYEALANDFVYANPKDLLVFGDNHDMDRLFTQLKEDVNLQEIALGYLLTIRGIPQVYYGTELLTQNTAKPGDHGLIRSEFPGGWPDSRVNGFTGSGLTTDQLRIQNFMRTLLRWRKNKTVIHQGQTLHFAPREGVYVYFRYDKQSAVMVAINKNEKAVPLSCDRFSEITGSKRTALNVISGKQETLSAGVPLPPRSISIFELQ